MNKSTGKAQRKTNDLSPKHFHDNLEGKEGEIIWAAFQCILEKGIAATSTYAIAAKAGINQGVIHYYFKSKDELLLRVLEVFFDNALANIESVFHSTLSAEEKLEMFLNHSHSLIVSRRDEWIVFNAFWAHAMSVGGKINELIQKKSRRFLMILVKLIKELELARSVKSGISKDIAILFISVTQGMANIYCLDPVQFDPQRLFDIIKELISVRLK